MKKLRTYVVEFPTNYGTMYHKIVVATSNREAINITYNGVGRGKQSQINLYKCSKAGNRTDLSLSTDNKSKEV